MDNKEVTFECPHCGYLFKLNKKNNFDEDNLISEGNRMFTCGYCGELFEFDIDKL